ncbi:hypothetical protein ANN_27408 [Periplaneta americana]|uniref:Uncharacterized protein n=1 Tax=Periplaneta americana TaxID=6978 RepID=A0ABQ8RVS6_PERAM|nr:hypothetical protein ANN_27408 [Periplaneta americana]
MRNLHWEQNRISTLSNKKQDGLIVTRRFDCLLAPEVLAEFPEYRRSTSEATPVAQEGQQDKKLSQIQFGPRVQRQVDGFTSKFGNICVTRSSPGKPTSQLHKQYLEEVRKTYVKEQPFLLILDSWEGQDRWIGRGSLTPWPARSPNLNSLDFWLWRRMKEPGYFQRVRDFLRRRAEECIPRNGFIMSTSYEPVFCFSCEIIFNL